MSILTIMKRLPNYASDIKRRLADLFSHPLEGLSEQQVYGVALVVGYSLGNEQLLNDIRSEAKIYLEDVDAQACKSASILMEMKNNIKSFCSNVEDKELSAIPEDFLSDISDSHNVSEKDFNVYCFAASVLNECNSSSNEYMDCIIKAGVPKKGIMNILLIVSVLKAAAKALEIEMVRSYDFIVREPTF